jgi:PhnB protein
MLGDEHRGSEPRAGGEEESTKYASAECGDDRHTLGESCVPLSCGATRPKGVAMTSIQPQLWVDRPGEALLFYAAAFGATVVHCVGEKDDIVAQLEVGGAPFWIAPTSSTMKRLSPREIDGATGRTTLVVDDPDAAVRRAVAAGATETSPVSEEHGWRLGRILDPFGQEWEIGAPLGAWPPR